MRKLVMLGALGLVSWLGLHGAVKAGEPAAQAEQASDLSRTVTHRYKVGDLVWAHSLVTGRWHKGRVGSVDGARYWVTILDGHNNPWGEWLTGDRLRPRARPVPR